MVPETKRLFFGLEVQAPWPEKLPVGRILDPEHRHLTLAFMGNIDWTRLEKSLKDIPLPPFSIGLVGCFDKPLLFPPRHPHVFAWHVEWWDDASLINTYQKTLSDWLKGLEFHLQEHQEFQPHVTICRSPFDPHHWKKQFIPLPMMVTGLHLYESIGGLRYQPIWSRPFHKPFQEIDHTADIAFIVKGKDLNQIHKHALAALAFHSPVFTDFVPNKYTPVSLDDIIMSLNRILTQIDQENGSPFKAVSYHGDIVEDEQGILTWEMIVDV